MLKRPSGNKQSVTNPDNAFGMAGYGAFDPGGKWEPNRERVEVHEPLYRAVRSLVAQRRRDPELQPRDFVAEIRLLNFPGAFPSVLAGCWDNCEKWLHARATTGVERTIVTAASSVIQ